MRINPRTVILNALAAGPCLQDALRQRGRTRRLLDRHLAHLRQAGRIQKREDGRWSLRPAPYDGRLPGCKPQDRWTLTWRYRRPHILRHNGQIFVLTDEQYWRLSRHMERAR